MNKRCPRTDPCLTPLEMGRSADILEQYLTTGLQSDRYDLNQETEFLYNNNLWETVSNAFVMSRLQTALINP